MSQGGALSPKNKAQKVAVRTKEEDKAIRQIAKKTANLKKEQLRIINANGEVVLEKKGEKGEVSSTVGEHRKAFWDKGGTIAIHNHPAGGTFSDMDLNEFGYGAKEIVVSAPEGTYRLVKTTNGIPDWVSLRDKVREIPEQSLATLMKEARKIADNSVVGKRLKEFSVGWTEVFQKYGKDEANARYPKEEYDRMSEQYKEIVESERRKLEVKPYDEVYKKYAQKYGMRYIFEPWKKK